MTIAPRSMMKPFVSREAEFLGALRLMKISDCFSEDSHSCQWSGIGNGWQCSEASQANKCGQIGRGIRDLAASAGLTIGGVVPI
ncbi:hypothetical protein [Rhizobium leguminosarum]|uniref:hypothetical protein n=1 Tax=Rhizobium leguminosarum TaxID=384 RepID=UPI001C959C9B|nr:hypothetical protein [Rhizobium leguminosarum]MBY5727776.1 hypothetical protein [Rhizobium leguminosarum]